MIPVSRPYFPSKGALDKYISRAYDAGWLTNNGPLLNELRLRLADYWKVDPDHLVLVANGSLALQVAFKALELEGEVLTTPFTFVATSSTLIWQGLEPVFVDIESNDWLLDADLIESLISPRTSAILPVHIFGAAADVEAVDEIANRHKLKTVYDASHCFDAKHQNRSLIEAGDASTISFHATKLFHTGEGGAVYFKDKAIAERARRIINFGFESPYSITEIGINAKLSELHAAMGLANLDEQAVWMGQRRKVQLAYWQGLKAYVTFQTQFMNSLNYLPVLFDSEQALLLALDRLRRQGIEARRYFFPSLNESELFTSANMPVSADISRRVLCLPCFAGLSAAVIDKVIATVTACVRDCSV